LIVISNILVKECEILATGGVTYRHKSADLEGKSVRESCLEHLSAYATGE